MPHALLRPADPIHAAVNRHAAAYQAWQEALEGAAGDAASAEYGAATAAILITPCISRFGALAFLDHLRFWLSVEAEFAAEIQPTYAIAQARAADLALFLGRGTPEVIPTGLPACGLPPGRRALNLRRAIRVRVMLEGLAAMAIIAGGVILTGLATMI